MTKGNNKITVPILSNAFLLCPWMFTGEMEYDVEEVLFLGKHCDYILNVLSHVEVIVDENNDYGIALKKINLKKEFLDEDRKYLISTIFIKQRAELMYPPLRLKEQLEYIFDLK